MNVVRIPLMLALMLGSVGCRHDNAPAQQEQNPDAPAVPDETVDDAAGAMEDKVQEALSALSPDDRKLAVAQRFCPIKVHCRLGSMGTPVKVESSGKAFFVCSKDLVQQAIEGGASTKRTANGLAKATARLAKLPPNDRAAAEAQKYCPVMSNRLLGTMGDPIKLELDGKPLFLCCPDCIEDAEASPTATLARAEQLALQQSGMPEQQNDHDHHHGEHEHGGHEHSEHEEGDHGGEQHDDREKQSAGK